MKYNDTIQSEIAENKSLLYYFLQDINVQFKVRKIRRSNVTGHRILVFEMTDYNIILFFSELYRKPEYIQMVNMLNAKGYHAFLFNRRAYNSVSPICILRDLFISQGEYNEIMQKQIEVRRLAF